MSSGFDTRDCQQSRPTSAPNPESLARSAGEPGGRQRGRLETDQGGDRSAVASVKGGELLVPISRFRPIVERYVSEHESPEGAYQELGALTDYGADTWRKRLSANKDSGWWRLDALDEADVDDFLSAVGLTHLWWTDLHDLLPEMPAFDPENPPKRRGKPCLISDDDLRTLYDLHVSGPRLSLNEIARRVYVKYGYSSHGSCATSISGAWRRLARRARDRISVTVEVSTTRGLSPRDYQERKRRRKEAGVRSNGRDYQPLCQAVKSQAPRKGSPCTRHAMFGSDFCHVHDPARHAEVEGTVAMMRSRLDARPTVAWADVHAQLWPWLARHEHPASRLSEASGVANGTVCRLLLGQRERVTVTLAGRLLVVLDALEVAA